MKAINGKRIGMEVLASVAMIAGLTACEFGSGHAGLRKNGAAPIASSPPEPGQAIIRHRIDPVRGRLWILTRNGVELYESSQGRKVASIKVPGWHWVSEPFAGAPDIALGPRGEAVITSNVMATLWRVDPETLAITRHEIAVEPPSGKDFGFTSLTYSGSRGAYYGVAAFDGGVWRIDPQLLRARAPGS
jgi:hypothetical protein